MFSDQLKAYLDQAGATSAELAAAAGIPPSTLSRYLSGERTPASASDADARLARALAQLSGGQLDERAVYQAFRQALTGSDVDQKTFTANFRTLMDALDISGNRLALALGFDPSYISRIRTGQRHPSNVSQFSEQVAHYVARNFTGTDQLAAIAELTGSTIPDVSDPGTCQRLVCAFLSTGALPEQDPSPAMAPLARFLATLDAFDLNSFLEEIHFNDIKVPTVPFQLPTTKTYTGIEEMKQAELDFLRAAVLARSKQDVIFYSDMPLSEMAQDKEFPKKVMQGVALLVSKGIKIVNIHDVYRPINELFMGLEGWVPVYMTGLMESYYLPSPTNTAFLHYLRSAGTVALGGEAVAGDQGSGRYTLVKGAADVAYYRTRATQLLAHARPLIKAFREGQERERDTALRKIHSAYGQDTVTVGEGAFATLTIRALPGHYVLISKSNPPAVDFLVEHPALVNAFEQYEPTLF